MNTYRNTTVRRCTLTVVAGLVATLTAGYAPTSATTGSPADSHTCTWTVDQLPRTPDAVEGWYSACPTPRLGTPDATEGWLR